MEVFKQKMRASHRNMMLCYFSPSRVILVLYNTVYIKSLSALLERVAYKLGGRRVALFYACDSFSP